MVVYNVEVEIPDLLDLGYAEQWIRAISTRIHWPVWRATPARL